MTGIHFHAFPSGGLAVSAWDVSGSWDARRGTNHLGSVQRFRDGGWRAFDPDGGIVGNGVFVYRTRREAAAALVEHHANNARWLDRIDCVRTAEIPGFVS